jgi:Flp pilus assembly protein TadG
MSSLNQSLKGLKRCEGAAMVEFSLILVVLLLIVLGTIQFGLAWYTKYGMACASREGARYAVIYHSDASGNRILPSALSPSIEQVVRDYLNKFLPKATADACAVVVTGPGLTGTPGQDIIVRVTCNNAWNPLGTLVAAWESVTYTAETVMKCE